MQALGDLLGFQRASRFTAHWLADAEAANGPEYRDLVAARFTKLRQILREGESPVPDAIEHHSSEACVGAPPALPHLHRVSQPLPCCTALWSAQLHVVSLALEAATCTTPA